MVAHFQSALRSVRRIVTAVAAISACGFAVLAIVIRQPTLGTAPDRLEEHARPDLLRRHVVYLTTDAHPRNIRHPDQLARAAKYIEDAFGQAGARVTVQRYRVRQHDVGNVIGEFGPAASPTLVIGAHYDAFGLTGALPGADDNASGVAGLLEIARLLRGQRLKQRVLLVAFANEEPPFFGSEDMGSAVHAEALARGGVDVVGMISLEMIGYFSGAQTWPNALFAVLYPSRGDFIGVAGGWPDRTLNRQVMRGIRGTGGIPAVSFTGPRETSDASDQRNYWRHGWPAVMVTDTAFLRNPNYHTARDSWQTLDYNRMSAVVDGVANAVLHIAN
jgi:hypothetical protein